MKSRTFAFAAFLMACAVARAQQTEIRLNPDMGTEAVAEAKRDYGMYAFLDREANVIKIGDEAAARLRERFGGSDSSVVRVLHIGDSHIQAEGATSRTRRELQTRYGSAGRGLTAPLRLAGTNAPTDYSIRSTSEFVTSRLLKRPWQGGMGFSGVSVSPVARQFNITVECGAAFDCLRVYSSRASVDVTGSLPASVLSVLSPSDGITDILLLEPLTEITLNLACAEDVAITAISLQNGSKGVEYSAIGNNGATFASYASIPDFGKAVSSLAPDLVVLSLGTNEAFGRFTADGLRADIDALVADIRRHAPDAEIMLTTPQECYKRSVTYSRRRGKKRRRVRSYSVNTSVERVRSIILGYAEEHGLPVYDWYAVAGGADSAGKWLERRLMNTDRIHLTWDGYHLQGDLFADALLRMLTVQPDKNEIEDEPLGHH
ncbi:MAG: hypothetical protein K2L27_08600 [Muribaculaceae bacterium]|nr:hypothetical protein [Muribaculaceae bacterium]